LIAALCVGTGFAQVSPSPSSSPSASPSPTPSPIKDVVLRFPKGWARCGGDSVAIQICAPTQFPDVRIAKTPADPTYTTDKGVKMMKDMVSSMFPTAEITVGSVCNGGEPAVITIVKDSKGVVSMKQVLVMGHVSGAIITFENPTGAAVDPAIDDMFNTLCWP
jgi:hypothetical protein